MFRREPSFRVSHELIIKVDYSRERDYRDRGPDFRKDCQPYCRTVVTGLAFELTINAGAAADRLNLVSVLPGEVAPVGGERRLVPRFFYRLRARGSFGPPTPSVGAAVFWVAEPVLGSLASGCRLQPTQKSKASSTKIMTLPK